MKKVHAIVVYHELNDDNIGYIVRNLTIIDRNSNHVLLYSDEWDSMDKKHPYIDNNFRALYKRILSWLKHNDYYCSYFEAFNSKFYDIIWIEDTNPSHLQRFGYNKDLID